jgi:L-asparaginase II
MVEVWRGALVESVHHGVAAVANAAGEIVEGWGDTALVTYPRSALKPIQAIALVETAHAAGFVASVSSARRRTESLASRSTRSWWARG